MTITVTYFQRPNGTKKDIEITKIHADDEAWFKANNIKLSAEEDTFGDDFILYADYGDPENEAIEFTLGKSSMDAFHALRETTEHLLRKFHAANQP